MSIRRITQLAILVCMGVVAVSARRDGTHTPIKKRFTYRPSGQGRGLFGGIVDGVIDGISGTMSGSSKEDGSVLGSLVDESLGLINTIKTEAIHASLNLVTEAFYVALNIFGDCIPLPNFTIEVEAAMFSRIETGKGKVCGIGNLKPSSDYTDTRNQKLLAVEIPLKVPNLRAYFKNFTVKGLIEGESLIVTINKVNVKAEIGFNIGSMLEFLRSKVEVTSLKDFHLEFTSKKSMIMEAVEGLSETIGEKIRQTINKKFKKLDDLISHALSGGNIPNRNTITKPNLRTGKNNRNRNRKTKRHQKRTF